MSAWKVNLLVVINYSYNELKNTGQVRSGDLIITNLSSVPGGRSSFSDFSWAHLVKTNLSNRSCVACSLV